MLCRKASFARTVNSVDSSRARISARGCTALWRTVRWTSFACGKAVATRAGRRASTRRPTSRGTPLRGRGGRAADVASNAAPGPERLARSAEIERHVASALSQLSPLERAAFTLRHYEGRSIDEIGRMLGLGTSATKHSVFRAVRKLRAAL